MQGSHLTADLHGCARGGAEMVSPEALRALCLGAVRGVGLTAVGELFHAFGSTFGTRRAPAPPGAPSGVTGVVLLAESHLAVHTWPELAAVTLDVYVCNLGGDNTPRAEALLEALLHAFGPARVERHALHRGALAAAVPGPAPAHGTERA